VAVHVLLYQTARAGRFSYSKTSPGAVASGDSFKLSLSNHPHGAIRLLHLRVAASGGSVTRVDPAAYLDAALTSTGKVWEGSWTNEDEAGPVFAAGDAAPVIPLDSNGDVWIDPGVDASAGAVTVAIRFEVA
jgi:hypothetical protein